MTAEDAEIDALTRTVNDKLLEIVYDADSGTEAQERCEALLVHFFGAGILADARAFVAQFIEEVTAMHLMALALVAIEQIEESEQC